MLDDILLIWIFHITFAVGAMGSTWLKNSADCAVNIKGSLSYVVILLDMHIQ
jgi:hypothetical protein